jgi:hypothetical protein
VSTATVATRATKATTAAGRRRARWIPGLIALAALLAIGIVFGAGADLTHPGPHRLSGRDVSDQLALGIQTQKGISTAPLVSCPSSEPVRAGFVFVCTVTGLPSHQAQKVEVTEIDRSGHLRWKLNSP